MKKKILSLLLCLSICFGAMLPLASCGGDGGAASNQNPSAPTAPGSGSGTGTGTGGGGSTVKNPDALVIMSEELDGLFNPFFSTTAADGNIVSMTQTSMLTMNYVNDEVVLAYGPEEPVVTLDFEAVYDDFDDKTTYTFVLKNGIKFSDGHALTIEDVLFNLYVYLDPVYTGSSTMYSTDIVGLAEYRAQKHLDGDTSEDAQINETAYTYASNRLAELINVYKRVADPDGNGQYDITVEEMKDAILNSWGLSYGYKQAVSSKPDSVTNAKLLEDYEKVLTLFRAELERDYNTAQSAYDPNTEPYKSWWDEYFSDPIFRFMCAYGIPEIKYVKGEGGKVDLTKIESIVRNYDKNVINTKEKAIEYIFDTFVSSYFIDILTSSATAAEIMNEYLAVAKSVILEANKNEDGSLTIPNIKGIVSVGHNTDRTTVRVNGKTYNVAREHNADGSPKNANEYDVLEITINKQDPKAIWNFAFSVAPQHYYGNSEKYPVDIAKNKFGVSWSDADFMSKTVQSVRNNSVPMGAGAYMATDINNNTNPEGSEFFKNNVVYFKANKGFFFATPKIDKIRYQVVSASNAVGMLKDGSVHFISPQYTDNNVKELDALISEGVKRMNALQLGYGYIGVSAEKIPDINLRKAIMCAMNTALSLGYYTAGTAQTIFYPMSTVSWAYPKDANGNPDRETDFDYPIAKFDEEYAKDLIRTYMNAAGVSAGDPSLRVTFTIAGSNAQDHPTYQTFLLAEQILESMGWDITVTADANALKKLSTGALSVWAAAWGSTVDPDLYQVYHKDSAATSTKAWGYDAIKRDPSSEEYGILTELSKIIDDARETNNQDLRKTLYKQALELILELAIELPVYQRSVLYAYDSTVIKSSSLPSTINPYSTPLDRIWDVEFAN
ncbi:MAG: hypothetical protein IKB38_03070 [Clostridia bacterium]|nr:hypothetical protein [Clostridia bacterium]